MLNHIQPKLYSVIIGLLLASFFPWAASYGKTHSAMSGYKPLKEMLESIFEGYEKRIRPFHKGSPMEIQVNTYIVELVHVDEFHKEFTLDVFIREYWIDPRLTFIPKPNIGSSIQLDPENSKNIWLPDTFVANERKQLYYEGTIMHEWIRLKSNGEVRRSIRRTLTASCPMTFYFYPFDRHLCTLQIESFGQDIQHIIYEWRGGTITPEATGIALNATNGTVVPFRVMSIHANKMEVELSTGNFSRLEVEITLQKYWGVYLSKYYIPLCLFILVALTTLWIRHAKFSFVLNLVNLVLFHLFLLVPDIGAKVPRTDYFKANDLYLYICLTFLYLAFLASRYWFVTSTRMTDMKESQLSPNAQFQIVKPDFQTEPGYREPKTYVRIAKDPSPDEKMRREPLLEGSIDRSTLRNIGTQTSLESAIYKILKICRILKWILNAGFIVVNIFFWTLLVILSEAYLYPERLVLVDYDF